jgi:hypothetical protein
MAAIHRVRDTIRMKSATTIMIRKKTETFKDHGAEQIADHNRAIEKRRRC